MHSYCIVQTLYFLGLLWKNIKNKESEHFSQNQCEKILYILSVYGDILKTNVRKPWINSTFWNMHKPISKH